MSALPRILGVDDLPLAELGAARLDGELFACGPAWSPPDVPSCSDDRAAAAATGLPASWIAALDTAAWIWGARDDAPVPATFCVAVDHRGAKPRPGVTVRETPLRRVDWTTCGAVRVTTPERTLADTLRRSRFSRGDELTALRLLDALEAGGLAATRARLARLPFGVLAMRRLDAISPR